MITSIADNQLDAGVVDALRHRDPLLSDTLVVEPFPDATVNDLIADINGELSATPPSFSESRDPRRALGVLMQSHVSTLVILGAEALSRNALREFTHLPDVTRLHSVVLVTGALGRHVHDVADATQTPRFLASCVTQHAEPVVPVSALAQSHHYLADKTISSIAFLAERMGYMIDAFTKAQLRLGVLAAALRLFDRPRSPAGTMVRLHGLDVALHQRGYRLRPDCYQHSLEQCAARTQLDMWLPDVILPSLPRDAGVPVDTTLDRPLPATAETISTWVRGLQRPQTRANYEDTVRRLLEWRARNGIAERDHNAGHLEDWAFDLLRSGAAIATTTRSHGLARRYHAYLLTGEPTAAISPVPYTVRHGLPAIDLSDDLRARISSTRRFREPPAYMNRLSKRPYRPPLNSLQGVRLLELFDNDLDRAWQRIEALRMPRALAHELRPLLTPTSPHIVVLRQIPNLNGVLLVLGTGIPWAGLPHELNYGSGTGAYRRLNDWVRDGRWPRIRDRLQEHSGTYRDLAWDRVPGARQR
jgi:hypothetical protein